MAGKKPQIFNRLLISNNKIFVLAIIFISLNSSLGYGQVTKEQFEESIDFVNCKLVEYSIWKSNDPDVKREVFQKACNCDEKPTYQQIKDNIPSLFQETIGLAEEIESIKSKENYSEWDAAQTVKFLSQNSFPDYPRLTEFIRRKYEKQKGGEFRDYRDDIRTKLSAQMNLPPPSPSLSPSPIQEPPDDSYWLIKLFFGFNILLFILIVVLYWWREIRDYVNSLLGKVKKKPSRTSSDSYEDMNIKKPDSNSLSPSVLQAIDFLKNENVKNKSKITSLMQEVSDLRKLVESNYNQTQLSSPAPERKRLENNEDHALKRHMPERIFYLPMPDEEGAFDERQALSNFKEGASIFRLIIKSDKAGTFQLEDRESSMNIALLYPERNISRVCTAENERNEGNRIVTIEAGEVKLVYGKWVVFKYAKIRYV